MDKTRVLDDVMPSATPSPEDIRAWQALPRDEQLARMKSALNRAADGPRSTRTMQDIKDAALAKIAKRENG
jgi:hypothetical protein